MANPMMWPKISVVVPSFNQARFLESTLCSIIDQKYPNLELIVIDGGSTDGSIEIIKKYEKHLAYWVSEPDGGQTKGLIKGFSRCTGEVQCWVNSDDLLERNSLREVAEYFQRYLHIDAVYGDALWVDIDGSPLREQREIPFNRFIWLYAYNYIPGMSMFWRRSVYEKVGGLNPEFDLAMDADLWIRFSDVGRIGHVGKVWSRMRFYPEQKNRRLRTKSDQEDLRIRARYWGTLQPPFYGVKRKMAQSIRVLWRLATGCYSIGYERNMEQAQKR